MSDSSLHDIQNRIAVSTAPRAGTYPADWILENQMGPNALWLVDELTAVMDLRPGMRVLDLGCGRALTSVFLAREYQVQVTAADLWVDPSDNWTRIRAAGVEDSVVPLRVDAHDFKFADGYFDAVVCVDAYEYFGTDHWFLPSLLRFLRPGGQVGVVTPGVRRELAGRTPDHLKTGWNWEFNGFHTPEWWRQLWESTEKVDVERADLLPDGGANWLAWEEAVLATDPDRGSADIVVMLRADAGQTLGFARVVARKPEEFGDSPTQVSLRKPPTAAPGALAERLTLPRYPRSAAYDPAWVMANVMGPQPLWLAEWLTDVMQLEPGMRVLDLGCGTALTSVFLAREFGAHVTAADLWIAPGDNWRRVLHADTGAGSVTPLRVEAHELPFADGYFDAVVSVDAYHYFGTDVRYLPTLARCVRQGGKLGMVAPATSVDFDVEPVPEHLAAWAGADFWTFRTPEWWRRTWERSGAVEVETADSLEDGWRDWLLWCEVCAEFGDPEWTVGPARDEATTVRADAGRALTFARVVASRS
ncbi:SAM-dependent methyltransferase [Micromonospora sp. CPCC 206061]|uniref:SAM-dependent methyltransferase n=1 Tax=Micromonospora sp. CPCC 206061 TaxID=3122410 RepID=UPI002FF03AE7